MAIHDLGCEAVSLTGSQAGIETDAAHTKAKITKIRADRVLEALDAGKIVLVAGFQGVSPETRDVTTLGRGGSDATAVALAAALGAACEIYSDVAGVFTADPRPSAPAFTAHQTGHRHWHGVFKPHCLLYYFEHGGYLVCSGYPRYQDLGAGSRGAQAFGR